jgi:hypothetical protein
MAGEETVREARGEAAKDGKKQSRDEAKAKSQHDDAEEVHEPEADDVQSMFSPIEHEDDDEDQSAGQDEEDQSAGQDDEDEKGKPGWLPHWLPKSFGVYEAASDSGVKVRRPRSLPPQRSTTTNPKLKAKLKALERDDEEKGKVFTFSPGPSQVVSTKMQKLIEEEIRQQVDDELKKFGRIPKTTKTVSRKLFFSPDSEGEEEDDDDAAQYRRRMQKTFEADELKKQDEALQKKKKEWYDEQERLKRIEQEIRSLEREREKVPSFQLFSQEEEVPKDELHSWYMKKEPEAADGKSKSSSSKEKDEELSTKEMLKILMQSQERTMQIALKATVSPSKEATIEETSQEGA